MSKKCILITGNRKGIGRYLSELYLSKGFNVVGCSRTESDLEHSAYRHVICDVTQEASAKRVVKVAKQEFGGVDILINNAGIASLNHSLLTPGSTVKKVFETNFYGSFFFSRECGKQMMKKKSGRIINFSTVAVPMNLDGEMVYASSKAAIEKMTKILAKELSNYNITVNSIGPTPILTDLLKVVPKDKVDELLEKQAIKRLGTFEDIENIISFFIDKKSEFVTGQILYLGGL
ncbi:SDR family NAD(P)-dependent oxidoreductase [Aquimarina algiphila]|uniref:SDR family NAD(P)-dependent oxidoreductase n=1 Tax=Aquimarina algiphila TaxID=2047982 RepID=UPI002331244E|nr:SDR family oxidoreductase [Aquimarina algiphila]